MAEDFCFISREKDCRFRTVGDAMRPVDEQGGDKGWDSQNFETLEILSVPICLRIKWRSMSATGT